MTWELSLNAPWFDFVKSGRKRYEGRRFAGQVKEFQKGDTIMFRDLEKKETSFFRKQIEAVHRFATFEAGLIYFKDHGLMDQALPNVTSIEEGKQIYFRFVSLATQLSDGICFIELRDLL